MEAPIDDALSSDAGGFLLGAALPNFFPITL